MRAKHIWWGVSAAVVVALGATAALGVSVARTYDDLEHGPAYQAPAAPEVLREAEPGDVDKQALIARLDALAGENRGALANFGAQVIDSTSGEVVWERDARKPLRPASSTKLLTAAAATLALDEQAEISTQVVAGDAPDSIVLRAAGDVWLSEEDLEDLAAQIRQKAPGSIRAVDIDTSAWAGPAQAKGWEPENVDEGFVAPMAPAMLYGGRIGETEGDVPRSHEPELDVARELGKKLGARDVGRGEASKGAAVLAQVTSAPLAARAQEMMRHSDNVAAEAIARELALAVHEEPSFDGDVRATLAVLGQNGFDVSGVKLQDNSGLSLDNRIPAALLAQIAHRAVQDERLRPLATYLPLAGGEGTLYERYGDSPARGYVRAKTGTLTGTSALAGTAQGQSGHVYSFAFLVNDGDLLAARRAQDALAAALHEF